MHWRIEGWDGAEKEFELDVTGQMGEQQVVALLQRLASRHLEIYEIVSASLPRRVDGYRELLEPHYQSRGGWPIWIEAGRMYLAKKTDDWLPADGN